MSTTEDDGSPSAEVDGMDIDIDAGEPADPRVPVSAQPPDALLPAHEAEDPSGDLNLQLPAVIIRDPHAPSDGCKTPDIDFSFM